MLFRWGSACVSGKRFRVPRESVPPVRLCKTLSDLEGKVNCLTRSWEGDLHDEYLTPYNSTVPESAGSDL